MHKQLLKRNKYVIIGLIIVCLLFLFGLQFKASALEVGLSYGAQTGLGTTDIRVTIARIINVAFGLLGAVAVVIALYGGFLWMTAQGEAEKIQKAKKVLLGAVIGVVIMLSSFAISSFILNQLIEATGGGTGEPPGPCTGTTCQCFGQGCWLPTGCSNPVPGSSAPFLCSLSPTAGPKGAYVTITGGNFSIFGTNSKVFFNRANTDYEAATCSSQSWTATSIVVEVPNTLPELGVYQIFVVNDGGDRSSSSALSTINEFTLNNEALGPGICTINPDNGKEGADVSLAGKRFGATQDTSNLTFSVNVNASFATATDWSDTQLQSKVPANAQTGQVNVNVVGKPKSNGIGFSVTCTANSDCATGCCYQSNVGKICADANYCQPGVGEVCADSPACTDAGCQTGLYCDAADCKCQARGPGSACDGDLTATGCQANNQLCGPDLYCSTAVACSCQYLPKIEKVEPINGAPGNFVTILGRGFGTEPGTVVLTSGTTEIPAALPTGCGSSDLWQDGQVIIQVPQADAGDYGIKLTNKDNLTAEWSGTFTINDIVRPGLCGISPAEGELKTEVSLTGKNFGTAKAEALLGGNKFDNETNWQWADNLIAKLLVPNLQPALLQAQVKVGEVFSNPMNFKVNQSAIAPRIDYIDPAFGPKGQYVTIFGSNFGSQIGTVRFYQGEVNQADWQAADTSFPQSCSAQYWHNNYIVIKVPDTGTIKDNGKIIVQTADDTFSNETPFSRCDQNTTTCVLRPGICRISPDQGPVATSNVTLYGENFGDFVSGQSKVNFWDNKSATDANLQSWTTGRIGTGQTGPNVPLAPLTVPAGATTGPVQVVDQAGSTSNKIQFKVADCRGQENICLTDSICCPTDGVCKTQAECFGEVAPKCNYAWTFTTGAVPDITTPPQVVEDKLCENNTQSPTPWKDSIDNCTNIWVSARFNMPMKVSTLSNINISLQICGNLGLFDENQCTGGLIQASQIDAISEIGFIFKPALTLTPNTWYKVNLRSGPGGIASKYNIWLDGNFDNNPGGDYTWSFRTKNSAEACVIDKVVVNPQDADLKTLSQTQEYNAFALANNCNMLDADAYNWLWYKKYSDGTKEDDLQTLPGYGVATISRNDLQPVINGVVGNGNNDYKQIATPVAQGMTYVGAQASDKKDEDNRLVVDLNIPQIDRISPDNGLVHPDVNAYVTVFGQNFGNKQGTSQVLFDSVPAQVADCPNAWSDTSIQVKVPKAKPITASKEPTYVQPTPTQSKNGMNLFYDFQDQSNVILKDKIGTNDGEIKGGQRVTEKFGQALSFSGTISPIDYVKLPNTLNLATGSLEMWFKPQGASRQTLFSASDGTAANNFFIDFANNNKFYIGINGQEFVSDDAPLKKDDWNYLVYTFDGSNINLYLNGFIAYSVPTNQGFLSNVANKSNVLLGVKNESGFSRFYKGLIGSFALYNNVLNQDDVWQHFGLAQGQLLLLNFEESGDQLTDSSANHFTGISVANSANMTRVNGISGQAVKLNNTHLNITNDPAFVFDKGITVEGWFKADTADLARIFDAGGVSTGIKLGILSSCGGTKFCMLVTLPGGNKYAGISLTNFRPKEWNYFAGVYDGNQIKVYLNGQMASYPAANDLNAKIIQATGFNNACLGGCADVFVGSLDQIAIYNRALSDEEIGSRVGAKDGSHVVVQTIGGQDTSEQTFKYSQNVYPFLCRLVPDSGLAGTEVSLAGENFGDSNKTTFQGKDYGVGSYAWFNNLTLDLTKVSSWANILVKAINPYSDVGTPEIPVAISTNTLSEPYNDLNQNGNYDDVVDNYADTNANGAYDPGNSLASNTLPFTLSPVITGITPDNGPRGQWVTIKGYNFGITAGQVYFYNNQSAELAPCSIQWTNNYIIAIVPPGADSGDVYITTFKGLNSNKIKFTVNNNPLGAGICDVFTQYKKCEGGTKKDLACNVSIDCPGSTCIATRSHNGRPGDQVYAEGDKFGDAQDLSNLIFTANRPAEITSWSNRNLQGKIPAGAVSGDVSVLKRVQTGSTCVGFHIASFCPSNKYETTYADIPSNAIPMNISDFCQSNYLGQYQARDGGFPLETWSLDSQGQKQPYDKINLGTMATDGTYIYSTGSALWGWSSISLVSAEDSQRTIFKIGSGFNGTDLGRVYKKYQFDYTRVEPANLRVNNDYWSKYPPYSLIITRDKKYYFGWVYSGNLPINGVAKFSWWVAQIIFDDTNNTYTFKFQPIPQDLLYPASYDLSKYWTTNKSAGALYPPNMAFNGDNIFVMSQDKPGGFVSSPWWSDSSRYQGYTFQVLDSNWKQIKEFTVSDIPGNPYYRTTGDIIIAADEKYLFIRKYPSIQVIDWRKGEFVGVWDTNHSYYSREFTGFYDWANQKYWLGSFFDDIPTIPLYPTGHWAQNLCPFTTIKHNRLYRYSRCQTGGPGFCRTDADCTACGSGNSRCINGSCSPYIESFSPNSGAVGTWVTLSGCYFGCTPGQVYFSDSTTSLPAGAQVRYTFNVNASNELGSGNDGTLKGNAVASNEALALDGNSSYVYAPLNVNEASTTVSFWFKTSVTTNQGLFSVVAAGNDFGQGGHDRHIYLASSGRVCTRIWSSESICTPVNTFSYGDWHNLVHVFGGTTGGQQIWVDGQKKVTGLKANSDFFWQAGINIGYSADAGTFFNGRIDEVQIYNRDLTVDEISNLYNGGNGRTMNNNYSKQGLAITAQNCGTTWNCSANYQQQLDQVIVEVPDKTSLPNMACPAGNCPPAGYDSNDAVTGPIKLTTSTGLSDSTVDLVPNNSFDVNTNYGPQICKLLPETGGRGSTVKIVGENFGDTPITGDFVNFEPTADSFAEPFTDANGNGTYDTGEKYTDINANGSYDTNLLKATYTTQIPQPFVTGGDCPANGWDNKSICFAVPAKAAGKGTPLNTANNNVSVSKNSVASNKLNYAVDFNSCGNGSLDLTQREECDGTLYPAGLTCKAAGYPYNKVCNGGSKKGLECAADADCPTSTCVSACIFQCASNCGLVVCDQNGTNCEAVDDLLCGNGKIDSVPVINYTEDCDGALLNGQTCQSKGYNSGTLACYTAGQNQCKFDTSGCSAQATLTPLEVVATVPADGEDKFCRNGIFDIYFNSRVEMISLESGSGTTLTRNIKVEACSEQTYSQNKGGGLASIVADAFRKLFSFGRKATAQQVCAQIGNENLSLQVINFNDKSEVSVIPTMLLDPGKFYKITISGGTSGVKSAQGGVLVGNSGADYVFGFKTLGDTADQQSGICNVEWIDVNVYRAKYTSAGNSLSERQSELRSDDLFMCAGKDTCRLDLDFDQDLSTAGNQHIYQAIGKHSGGISLKANYKWSRTDISDPQRSLTLYNQSDDTDTDPQIVKNETGAVFVTAAPIKEAIAKLVIEAQAQGSFTSPAQKDFLVYTLLCENPWPSINEKFPISSIINAYNFQTYYCRDATTPGGQLLPAAKYLLPDVNRLNTFLNKDFEYGNLSNWNKLFGIAFDSQPVYSDITLKRDGLSSKIQGNWWVGTKENYHGKYWEDIKAAGQGNYATGVLSSPAFIIEGDQLKFLIGGSNNPWPQSAMDAEAPGENNIPDNVTAVTLEVRDPNDPSIPAKFYVRLSASATGAGTTTMSESVFNISSYQGKIGIIKIYDNNQNGYINFDDLRQYLTGKQIPIRF